MKTTTDSSLRERVGELHAMIAAGQVLEAFAAFYGPDVELQENDAPPTVGYEACLEKEKAFVAGVAEWKAYDVLATALEGDTAFVEIAMAFTTKDGRDVRQTQVSRSRWKDGKIVSERFYHG